MYTGKYTSEKGLVMKQGKKNPPKNFKNIVMIFPCTVLIINRPEDITKNLYFN